MGFLVQKNTHLQRETGALEGDKQLKICRQCAGVSLHLMGFLKINDQRHTHSVKFWCLFLDFKRFFFFAYLLYYEVE